MSKRLQLDLDLTIEKAKKIVRQQEAVHEQQQVLQGSEAANNPKTSEELRYRSGKSKWHPKPCTRCGKEQHTRDDCPAKGAYAIPVKRRVTIANSVLARTCQKSQQLTVSRLLEGGVRRKKEHGTHCWHMCYFIPTFQDTGYYPLTVGML